MPALREKWDAKADYYISTGLANNTHRNDLVEHFEEEFLYYQAHRRNLTNLSVKVTAVNAENGTIERIEWGNHSLSVPSWTYKLVEDDDADPERCVYYGLQQTLSLNPLESTAEKVHCSAGPMHLVFFGYATAFDLKYDWMNWVSPSWQSSGCGADRSVYFEDASHGGVDGWEDVQTLNMQRKSDECWGSARHHMRAWVSKTGDTHEEACAGFSKSSLWLAQPGDPRCDYAFANAHRETSKVSDGFKHKVVSYDIARDDLLYSMENSEVNFVGYIGSLDVGNEVSGKAYGFIYFVELIA